MKEQRTFAKYYMAAETLHDLNRDRLILETASTIQDLELAQSKSEQADTRHEQITIWTMAIIKSRQKGLRNRGVAINKVDQLADEYAQMIPSLLGHRNADIQREVWIANRRLDEIEPSLLSIEQDIDREHIRCLEMCPEDRDKFCPDYSDEYFEHLYAVTVEYCRKRAEQILSKLDALEIEVKRLREAEKIILRE